jgi:hypothetical protein
MKQILALPWPYTDSAQSGLSLRGVPARHDGDALNGGYDPGANPPHGASFTPAHRIGAKRYDGHRHQ